MIGPNYKQEKTFKHPSWQLPEVMVVFLKFGSEVYGCGFRFGFVEH